MTPSPAHITCYSPLQAPAPGMDVLSTPSSHLSQRLAQPRPPPAAPRGPSAARLDDSDSSSRLRSAALSGAESPAARESFMERAMSATAAMLLRSSSWLRCSACGRRHKGGARQGYVSAATRGCCGVVDGAEVLGGLGQQLWFAWWHCWCSMMSCGRHASWYGQLHLCWVMQQPVEQVQPVSDALPRAGRQQLQGPTCSASISASSLLRCASSSFLRWAARPL